MLKVDAVHKSYATAEGRVAVLDGVSLALAAGESLALTGESGSGKSTLLHLIAGLDAVDGGEIVVAGQPLSGLGDAGRAGDQPWQRQQPPSLQHRADGIDHQSGGGCDADGASGDAHRGHGSGCGRNGGESGIL